ncbi:hypothetical protein GUITHDRAFT_99648 [Guillardia theta CCMP2712]|uniref:Uncharacterized protein n=1 Tax=Guillardia theta (strain CCMP2712) TaxID=905079 RepID=L1K3R7_GUITC|nr:hypothetical protein GUITHDRAFT_99648 [Guillardia theta CCMP2712]EKX55008.1 hypothetical protein GUITHDRAFT_99648 [Guillardia theta CCMP2712]|eukprot:XP_005841988.1 hypothetical protein GUITHDRAFT_99648 [Guillardia theta CCMP2712]
MSSLSPVDDVEDYEFRRSERTPSDLARHSWDRYHADDESMRRTFTPPMAPYHPDQTLVPVHDLQNDWRGDDDSLEKRINSVDNMIKDIKKILPHASWDQEMKPQQETAEEQSQRSLNRVSFDEDRFSSRKDNQTYQRSPSQFLEEVLQLQNTEITSSPLDHDERQQAAARDRSQFVQAGVHDYSLPVARDLSSRRDYLDLAHQTFLGALNPVKFVLNEFAPEEDERALFARAGELYLQVTRQLFESQEANAKLSKAISVMTEENKRKFGEMETEVVSLRNECFELQNKMDEERADHASKVERVVREGESSLSAARGEIAKLRSLSDNLQQDNQRMKETHAAVEASLTEELEAARARISADSRTIETLQTKINVLEEDLNTLSQDFEEISRQRADYNDIERDLNVARMNYIEKMRAETYFLNNYRDDVVGMDTQLHALLQDNLELAKNCSSLHADLMVVTEGRASLQRQLAFHLDESEKHERRLQSELKKVKSLLLLFIGISRKVQKIVAYEGWISEWLYRRHIRQRAKILRLAHKRRWWKKLRSAIQSKHKRDLRSLKALDLSKIFTSRGLKCIFTDWRVVHRIRRLSLRFHNTFLNPTALLFNMVVSWKRMTMIRKRLTVIIHLMHERINQDMKPRFFKLWMQGTKVMKELKLKIAKVCMIDDCNLNFES